MAKLNPNKPIIYLAFSISLYLLTPLLKHHVERLFKVVHCKKFFSLWISFAWPDKTKWQGCLEKTNMVYFLCECTQLCRKRLSGHETGIGILVVKFEEATTLLVEAQSHLAVHAKYSRPTLSCILYDSIWTNLLAPRASGQCSMASYWASALGHWTHYFLEKFRRQGLNFMRWFSMLPCAWHRCIECLCNL